MCWSCTGGCKTLNVLSKQREIQFFTSNLFDAQNHIAKCILWHFTQYQGQNDPEKCQIESQLQNYGRLCSRIKWSVAKNKNQHSALQWYRLEVTTAPLQPSAEWKLKIWPPLWTSSGAWARKWVEEMPPTGIKYGGFFCVLLFHSFLTAPVYNWKMIKCLKGYKSLGSLFESVFSLSLRLSPAQLEMMWMTRF